jgi:predicted Zn-dependent protease
MKFIVAVFMTLFTFSADCMNESDAFRIIRDAEIEETLTDIVKHIFRVAGLRPESARIHIVDDDVVNAFTIGNGDVFINSGLLLKFDNPLHLIGVLCHETGHLAAGHINRLIGAMHSRASNLALATIASILGGAVAGTDCATAILLGYVATDDRTFLHFSREQELAADTLAASYLKKLGYDSRPLIEVFDAFERMEILGGSASLPSYVRSHPKTTDRILAIEKWRTKKKYTVDEKLLKKYKRAILKLKAYLKANDWRQTEPTDDYSRAIYLHRKGKSTEAVKILKKLTCDNPDDIYYNDTLAQTLCESGQLKEAITVYRKIYNKESHTLIKIDFARTLLEADQDVDLAISILESVKYIDYMNSEIFRLLAIAYGKKNRKGLSFLMLAQEQMLLQNYSRAHELLKNSIAMMDKNKDAAHIKKAKYLDELLKREARISLQEL